MGRESKRGWTWTAPLEWAKGSPWRPERLDALREEDRLKMAAVLSNKELGFLDRRLARAFRDPRDLCGFLLAGVDKWGVGPQFAPMRALSRAEHMDRFLSAAPAVSGAAWAWKNAPEGHRSGGVAGILSPSNAFTLMFKRRSLPEMAAASVALKNCVSVGCLTLASIAGATGGWGPLAMGFLMLAGGMRGMEALSSDLYKEQVRELWALRKMACSAARLERLGREAFERARALGHRLEGEPESVGEPAKEARLKIKALREQARRIDQEREELLKGDLLGALDRSQASAGLRERARELRRQADEGEEAQKRAKATRVGEIQGHLRCFLREAQEKGWTAVDMDQLRGAGRTRVESAELASAIKPAPKLEKAAAGKLGSARL